MRPVDIQNIIETELANTQAIVNSADNVHFDAVIISPAFANKSKVQQQQLIYQILNTQITSGEIHALSLKTYTPEAWQAINQ